jgi:hypothetical protein
MPATVPAKAHQQAAAGAGGMGAPEPARPWPPAAASAAGRATDLRQNADQRLAIVGGLLLPRLAAPKQGCALWQASSSGHGRRHRDCCQGQKGAKGNPWPHRFQPHDQRVSVDCRGETPGAGRPQAFGPSTCKRRVGSATAGSGGVIKFMHVPLTLLASSSTLWSLMPAVAAGPA